LAAVERTATPRGREQSGYYSIEGVRLHERALRAGVAIESCLFAESLAESPDSRVRRLLDDLEAAGCRLVPAPDEVLATLTEGRGTGALMGLVPLPPNADLAGLLDGARRRGGTVGLLVLADVLDPGNVGALLRTALAAGALAVVCVGVSDPFHARAVRTSMGSLFKLPLLRAERLEPLLERLRVLGVSTWGAVAKGGTPLRELPEPATPVALIVGGEAFGLDPGLSGALDARVSIPMAPGVDSLSVNAAVP